MLLWEKIKSAQMKDFFECVKKQFQTSPKVFYNEIQSSKQQKDLP